MSAPKTWRLFRRICLQDNEIAAFVQLGVRRRYQKLRDELLGQCRPMPKDRPHRCLFKERKAAIMIDLDGTLMDSTVQRGRALERALAELHATSLLPETFRNWCNDHASRLDFFEKNVYALYPFFKWLKLGDFRQEWNHPGWYAAYIAFAP